MEEVAPEKGKKNQVMGLLGGRKIFSTGQKGGKGKGETKDRRSKKISNPPPLISRQQKMLDAKDSRGDGIEKQKKR